MKKDFDLLSALGMLMVALTLLSLVLVAMKGWDWYSGFLGNGLPAWIQAVGSIGAIIATGWMARRQHENDVAREFLAETRAKHAQLEGAFQLAGGVLQVLNKAVRYAGMAAPPDTIGLLRMKNELAGLIDALKRADKLQFDDYLPISALLMAQSTAQTFAQWLEVEIHRQVKVARNPWPDAGEVATGLLVDLEPKCKKFYEALLTVKAEAKRGISEDVHS